MNTPGGLLRVAAAAVAGAPLEAFGHGTAVHGLGDLAHAYTLDPWVLVPLALLAALYTAGVARLWKRAGRGCGVSRVRVAAFCGGMLALGLALVWPLDALAGAALSAHMAQHVMLTAVAAPLLAGSSPIVVSLWGLPRRFRRALGAAARPRVVRGGRSALALPVVAWSVYAALLWGWHMPGPYQAALERDWLHTLEHVGFLGGALVLWWAVWLSARDRVLGLGSGVFLLFTTGLQEGMLGALFTFSGQPLYPFYAAAPGLWEATPLEDQQLAGVLMWIAGGAVYLGAGLALTYVWLRELERGAGVQRAGTTATPHGRVPTGIRATTSSDSVSTTVTSSDGPFAV